jgi:hypothetical protein
MKVRPPLHENAGTPRRSHFRMTKFRVTVMLTFVSVSVTYKHRISSTRTRSGRHSRTAGRVRCPRAGLQPVPGRLRASTPRHYDRGARCNRWTGTGRGGESPLKGRRKTPFATSQEAWPEAASLAMKDSLGREPWWNADRCAPPAFGGAAVPVLGTAEYQLRLSAFRFRIFFFVPFPFVIAGLDPAIHAEATLAQCFPPALGRGASAWTTGKGV